MQSGAAVKVILISVCLIVAAFAAGMLWEAYEAGKKPRNHRQPSRYLRE